MPGYDSIGSLGTASNPFVVTTVGGSTPNAIAVEGTVAHGQAESGNPVTVGGRADSAYPAAVTAGQRVRAWFNQNGAQMVASATSNPAGDASGVGLFGGLFSNVAGASIYLVTAGMVFNGASWDRMRGDTSGTYTVEKNRATFYTTAPSQTLAAAAVFTGPTRDIGAAPGAPCAYARYGVFINASQAGTLTVQGSDDNFATSFVAATQAVAAGTPVDIAIPARARYYRTVFTNGATAQTAIVVKDGFSA